MRRHTRFGRLIRAIAPLPLLLAAAPSPSPGLWQHSIVYVVDTVNGSSLVADQAQGMLPSPPPFRVCYSAADLADPRAFLLAQKASQCRFLRFAMANGQLSAAGDCADSRYPSLHVEGTGSYGASGYDFTFSGHARSGEVVVDFRGRDSGRRVGSCTAGGDGG